MIRIIAAVIAGYCVIVTLVMSLFRAAYFGLGPDTAFRPGSYEPSDTWIWISFALGLLAAIGGGLICAAIGKSWNAVLTLAIVVFLLGLLMAIPTLMEVQGEPQARAGEDSFTDVMMKARTPGWVALVNPVIGAAGVILGGRIRKPAAAPVLAP